MWFDRFDIMAAYNVYSQHYGWDDYTRGIQARLDKLGYQPSESSQRLETLSVNAKRIYGGLLRRRHRNGVASDRLVRRAPQVLDGTEASSRIQACLDCLAPVSS